MWTTLLASSAGFGNPPDAAGAVGGVGAGDGAEEDAAAAVVAESVSKMRPWAKASRTAVRLEAKWAISPEPCANAMPLVRAVGDGWDANTDGGREVNAWASRLVPSVVVRCDVVRCRCGEMQVW